jgi:hypothetical protein
MQLRTKGASEDQHTARKHCEANLDRVVLDALLAARAQLVLDIVAQGLRHHCVHDLVQPGQGEVSRRSRGNNETDALHDVKVLQLSAVMIIRLLSSI